MYFYTFIKVTVYIFLIFFLSAILFFYQKSEVSTEVSKREGLSNMQNQNSPYRALSDEEKRVILLKGTEPPFSGALLDNSEAGIYICRQCQAELYESESKFKSGCGWPSFDDEIKNAVTRVPDKDGRRTEIICSACQGHLGHVFSGENMTEKNTRHCVNSISLEFVPLKKTWPDKFERAWFAGGCFWGVEHLLARQKGVITAQSGYMGGHTDSPDYKSVCTGTTGHAETVELIFDPELTDYKSLAKLFFEIHDPGQLNRQGPDIGTQYRSAVFYASIEQKRIIQGLIDYLVKKGHKVVTRLEYAHKFWTAENYHQNYYGLTENEPYCHARQIKFRD
jgi:peptide methionine sulfoxide reductase msrA/msrB